MISTIFLFFTAVFFSCARHSFFRILPFFLVSLSKSFFTLLVIFPKTEMARKENREYERKQEKTRACEKQIKKFKKTLDNGINT